MNKQFDKCPYRKINTQTAVIDASPHQLISLLYSGLLEQLSITKGCIERSDTEGRCFSINRSIRILGGLSEFIDLNVASGSLARNLMNLYNYMIRRLSKANILSDEKIIDEVINLIIPIQASWISVSSKTQKIIN
tara:strand:+ start:492 stop:896 length:405 start_codon:yes stop_codon:yes gene_type:complete